MSAQNVQLIPQQQQPVHSSPIQETPMSKQPSPSECQPCQFPPTSSSQIQEENSYARMVNSKKSIKSTKTLQSKPHNHKLEAIEQILIELEKEEIRERKLQLIKIIYQKLLQDNEHIQKLTTALNQFHDENQFLIMKINQLQEAHLKKEEFLLENYTNDYQNICNQFKESKKVLDDLDCQLQKILKFANNQAVYNGQIRKKIIQINNSNIKEQEKLRVFVDQYHNQEAKKRMIFKQQVLKFQKMLEGVPSPSQNQIHDNALQKISQRAEEQHFSSQGNVSEVKSIHVVKRTTTRNRNEKRRSQSERRIKEEINKIEEQNKFILRECLSQTDIIDNNKAQKITLLTIVPYLQQTKTLYQTYLTQLEIQMQILQKRLKQQSTIYKQYIGEQNQKIDELMNKFQQLEQFRVRTNAQNLQKQENQQKCLYNQLQKLKEQNSQFTQICEKSKKQLQTQRRKVQNLEYQIRELSQQKQKIVKQKNDIIAYNDKIKLQLGSRIQIQQAQLQANDRKIYEMSQIIEQFQALQVSYNANQQSLFQLQSSIFQNEKFISNLQQKLQQKNQQELTYLQQLQTYKKQLKQLQQKLSKIQKEYQQKEQRYLHQKTILIKNNEDLKYLNTILKKDICKIQEIQAIDWQKQFQDSIFAKKNINKNGKVNKCMKVNKTSHFNFGQELDLPPRSKNYSYTNSNNTNVQMNTLGHSQINYGSGSGSGYNTSQKYSHPNTNTLKSSYISTVNQNLPNYTKQNLTSSRIFMQRQPNVDRSTYFETKIDLDFMNKKHSIQTKTQPQTQYYTERPLTDLVKKKYQF